ncbi:MAG: 3-isopropylmalate dehydratase small subunit [Opitutales bacterium]
MAIQPIKQVAGKGVYVPGDDIDTDRIIPARFMKCITFDGLGEYLFHDVRKTEDGELKPHNLNDPRFAEASILITGNNFGCGSSREHAPQSIMRAGYKAVIAGSFAEIFFGNATNLGVVCVTAKEQDREVLRDAIERDPDLEITIDLGERRIWFDDENIPCDIKPGARDSFFKGTYDPLAELLDGAEAVDEAAARLPYMHAGWGRE